MACEHICLGNCRREGCNCECGEFHCDPLGKCRYEGDEECPNHPKKDREFSADQERIIRNIMKACEDAECDGSDHKEHA